MNIFKYFIVIIIFLQIVSCTKSYTYNFNDIEKHMVVNSFFNPDSLMIFKLKEEASLSDNISNGFKTIDNAQILIYGNNTIVDTANYTENGSYKANIKPQKDITYKIEVSALGYDNITAEDKIPNLVKIDTLIVKKTNDEAYSTNIKIVFNDPEGENNYYFFSIYWFVVYEEYRFRQEAYYITEDPVIGLWINTLRKIPIFNDNSFNGQRYELSVNLQTGNFRNQNCYINLFSISKSMYLYIKSYNKQMPGFDDMMELFQQGLIEPIPIYTNVKGGLGIFGGYAVSQDSLFFE